MISEKPGEGPTGVMPDCSERNLPVCMTVRFSIGRVSVKRLIRKGQTGYGLGRELGNRFRQQCAAIECISTEYIKGSPVVPAWSHHLPEGRRNKNEYICL